MEGGAAEWLIALIACHRLPACLLCRVVMLQAAQVDRLMEGVVKLTESKSLTNKDLRLLAQW